MDDDIQEKIIHYFIYIPSPLQSALGSYWGSPPLHDNPVEEGRLRDCDRPKLPSELHD